MTDHGKRNSKESQRSRCSRQLATQLISCIFLSHSFLIVSGVSPTPWMDGIQVTSPNFGCVSANLGENSESLRMMQDRRNTSLWFIACSNQLGGPESSSLLYYGTLDQLNLIYNQTYDFAWITMMTQVDSLASVNLLYFLTNSYLSDSITSIDTETFITTQIPLPMQPGLSQRYSPASFTLLSIDSDSLLVQPAYSVDMLFLYNTTTTNWTTINLPLEKKTALWSITYSATTTVLLANVVKNDELILASHDYGVYSFRRNTTTGSFIDGHLSALMPWHIFRLSVCDSSSGYFIRDSTLLIGICNSTIRAWNLTSADGLNGSSSSLMTVSSINGTLLFDSNRHPDLCAFLPPLTDTEWATPMQTFTWHHETQTIFVGCSTGSAGALSIQSIDSTTPPIITSIISTNLCTQISSLIVIARPTNANGGINMTFLNVSHQSITIFLPCAEGIFFTSGRSLHVIDQVAIQFYAPVLTDPTTNSFYFGVGPSGDSYDPSLPSLYRLHGLDLIPLLNFSVCIPQSYTHNPVTRTFYLLCTTGNGALNAFVSVRMQNSTTDDTTATDEIAEIIDHFNIPEPYFWPSMHYTRDWGVYLIGQVTGIVNGTPTPVSTIYQFSEGQLAPNLVSTPYSMIPDVATSQGTLIFTVAELPNHSLIVGVSWSDQTQQSSSLWIISCDSLALNPANWSDGRLIIADNVFNSYSPADVQVSGDGSQAWFIVGDNRLQMVQLDVTPYANYTWRIFENTPILNYVIYAIALDDARGRVFLSWAPQPVSHPKETTCHVSVFDMRTGIFTETVSPATPTTAIILQLAIDQTTGSLMIAAGAVLGQAQIIIYSDQWTCSPGMEWIDGQCQPCNPTTARGFISYENAIRSSPQCESCRVGRFSNRTGVSECRLCDPGRYSSSRGSIICEYCQLNQYNNMSGWNSTCSLCSSGSQSFIAGATICSSCTLGQANEPGQSCQTCPINTYSPSLGAACLTCTDENQEGLQCLNGLANVNEGWWAYQLNVNGSFKFVTTQCPPSYCPGSALQNPNTTLCQYPRLNSHDNWLCAECVSDHIPWGSSCEPCTRANVGLLILILLIAVLLVLFLLRSSSAAGPLTILVFFVQIAALELGPVSHWIDWIQFTNFGLQSTRSCLLPIMPFTQIIVTMFVPLMLFVILALLCCINYLMSHFFRDASHSSSRVIRYLHPLTRDFGLDRYIGCAMAILIFCYTSITVTCVQSLHCVSVAPGIDRLFSVPTIDCNSHEYETLLLPVAIGFLIVYVIGFPLAMFIFLWHSSSTIRQVTGGHLGNSFSDPTFQRFAARWSHFYYPYRSEVWYWQPVTMLRRFAFALISVLLIESPSTKYVMYSSIGLFSFLVHSFLSPFVSSRWNHLESASYIVLIYVSFLLTSITPPFGVGIQVTLFFLIVPFSLLLVIMTIRMIWIHLKSKLPMRQRSLTDSPVRSVLDNSEVQDERVPLPISSSSHGLRDPLEADDEYSLMSPNSVAI